MLQDIATYEETQESLALLKMLAQSSKSLREGRSKACQEGFRGYSQTDRRTSRVKRYHVHLAEDAELDLVGISAPDRS